MCGRANNWLKISETGIRKNRGEEMIKVNRQDNSRKCP